ncbi:Probable 5'-nucleotidase precursor [Aggregatibacter aphrophilus]|uniref:Probable 5'-nucleotidase n=1 Tax=Aggregatibacter aphrophilus TaxID=732 RepID=A0A336NAE7_AGGAP|nr:Probable 5'-nucleotidase precursor [Aggregatibacter aphrophilus]
MEGSLIKQALEDALQFALVDGSTGGFPYGRVFVMRPMKRQMPMVNA